MYARRRSKASPPTAQVGHESFITGVLFGPNRKAMPGEGSSDRIRRAGTPRRWVVRPRSERPAGLLPSAAADREPHGDIRELRYGQLVVYAPLSRSTHHLSSGTRTAHGRFSDRVRRSRPHLHQPRGALYIPSSRCLSPGQRERPANPPWSAPSSSSPSPIRGATGAGGARSYCSAARRTTPIRDQFDNLCRALFFHFEDSFYEREEGLLTDDASKGSRPLTSGPPRGRQARCRGSRR